MNWTSDLVRKLMLGVEGGFDEKSLTIVEVTKELERGENCLQWKSEET
jgi:hypothetical protein